MAEQLNVAMIQMQVGKSLSDNLAVARQKCGEATALDAELIVLPEYFADMYGVGADPRDADHPPQSVELDSICTTLSEIAAQHKVTIHGGSFLERDGDHVYNTNPVYGPDGKLVTTYRKQHLSQTTPFPLSCRTSRLRQCGNRLYHPRPNGIHL